MAPIAVAGSAQNALTGSVFNLDGRASLDPDSDPLTYSWTFTLRPQGSLTSLTGASTSTPSFTPDIPGTYIITLTVNDGRLSSIPFQKEVVVADPSELVSISSIELRPEFNELLYGSSETLSVFAKFSNGTESSINSGLSWTSETAACSFSTLDSGWLPYDINKTVNFNPADNYILTKNTFLSFRDRARNGDVAAINSLQLIAREFLTFSRTAYASSGVWQSDLDLVLGALDQSSSPTLYTVENTVTNSCALGRWRQFIFELRVDNDTPFNAYYASLAEYNAVLLNAKKGSIESAWRYYGVAGKLNKYSSATGSQLQVAGMFLVDVPVVQNYIRSSSSVLIDEVNKTGTAVMLDTAKITVKYQGFTTSNFITVK